MQSKHFEMTLIVIDINLFYLKQRKNYENECKETGL